MHKLFIANWKSNKTITEAQEWLALFETRIKPEVALEKLHAEVVICPPFPFVGLVAAALERPVLRHAARLGVQDISPFPAGSYTGAVCARNLSDLNVSYAILGHSERRRHFNETSADVAKKVEQCLENGITPIICADVQEFESQANALDKFEKKKLVVAYEPVSHIGTGEGQAVEEVLENIKKAKVAFGDVTVIYGGSANLENIEAYLAADEIAGFLVGSASLDAEQFADMVKKSSK